MSSFHLFCKTVGLTFNEVHEDVERLHVAAVSFLEAFGLFSVICTLAVLGHLRSVVR
jgi:hypothetical protein